MNHISKWKLVGGLSFLSMVLLTASAWAQNGQPDDAASAAVGLFAGMFVLGLLGVALVVFLIVAAGQWKIFTKAGKPGWASFIPIYNLIVLLEITQRPIWWVVLMFIPLANIVVGIILLNDLARKFGQGAGFTVGLFLLPIIFFPLLGFGNYEYDPAL